MLKILKYRLPPALFGLFKLSSRNNSTCLIQPQPSNTFTYNGSKIWNIAVKILAKNEDMTDIKIGPFKRKLKNCLLDIQNMYDSIEWYQKNFEIETALQIRIEQGHAN